MIQPTRPLGCSSVALALAFTVVSQLSLSGASSASNYVFRALNQPEMLTPPSNTASNKAMFQQIMKWPYARTYEFFLYQLALGEGMNIEGSISTEQGKTDPFDLGGHIDVRIPDTFQKDKLGRKLFTDPTLTRCVRIAGDADLPLGAATVMADCFVNGLLVRLFLEDLAESAEDATLKETLARMKFPDGISDSQRRAFKDFTDPSKYLPILPKGAFAPIDEGYFKTNLNALIAGCNLWSIGTIWGWQCASRAIHDASAPKDELRQLLQRRYTPRQMGALVCYTLNFSEGYAYAQVFAGEKPTAELGSESLSATVFEALLGAYSLVSSSALEGEEGSATIQLDQKPERLRAFFDFLRGYQEGGQRAVRDVASASYSLGFQTGYKEGFRAGYEAGHLDGTREGERGAWKEANKQIDQLKAQLASGNRSSRGSIIDRIGKGIQGAISIGKKIFSLF